MTKLIILFLGILMFKGSGNMSNIAKNIGSGIREFHKAANGEPGEEKDPDRNKFAEALTGNITDKIVDKVVPANKITNALTGNISDKVGDTVGKEAKKKARKVIS